MPEASGDKSFANLLSKYGISSAPNGTISGQNYNVALSPLYFTRSGLVDLKYQNYGYMASLSQWWASVIGRSLLLNYAEVRFASDPAGYGFFVRCVVR